MGFLLWVSVPFILFFFLTFPGRRYFMQAMPQWTILAAVGSIELASVIGRWRSQLSLRWPTSNPQAAVRRAFHIALATPILLMAGMTCWSNRRPIELSLTTERAIGERIFEIAGPGHRVLSFTVTAFYSGGERVPLWGPMEGIVRCHGYGTPLSYENFLAYVRRHGAEFVVFDDDLRHDCPEFLDRARPEDFQLVFDDIEDNHGPCPVYRYVGTRAPELRAN